MSKVWNMTLFSSCFILLLILIGCKNQEKPMRPVIQDLIRKSFVNKHYIMRMGIDTTTQQVFTILINEPIKDSVILNGDIYLINPKRGLVNHDSIITVRLDSIDVFSRVLNMEHIYPNLENKIFGNFHFTYKNKEWVLIRGGASIADGKYTQPKF